MATRQARQATQLVASYVAILLIGVITLFPIYWILTTSIKEPSDILASPPHLFLFAVTLGHYGSLLTGNTLGGASALAVPNFYPSLLNSAIVGTTSVGLSLLVGTPAAYALARFHFRGKGLFASYVLLTRMLPPLGIIIPVFVMYTNFNLIDTRRGLIALYVAFNLSLVIWMMRGFFQEIPRNLEEAAQVDGASRLGAIWRVALPLAAPGLVATAILNLIFTWNEFLFALMLTSDNARTAPVAASLFVSYKEIAWGSLSAAGTVILLPILIFALVVQRHLVRGLTAGAVKE
jgi:multiple sugar transport system permease protein